MRRGGRLRVGQRFALVIIVLGLLLATGVLVGAGASERLADARERLVGRIDPALLGALRLQNAYLDQETGVRGFVLAGDLRFREPFDRGLGEQRRAAARLRAVTADDRSLALAASSRAAGTEPVPLGWRHLRRVRPVG